MKLGKTTWLLLATGILVILLASLGVAYYGQQREQGQLNQELSLTRLRLASFSPDELSSQQTEMGSHLAQAESNVKAIKAQLNQSINNIEIADTLLEIAEASDVEVIETSLPSPTSYETEGITFHGLPLTVTIEGDVSHLISFVHELSEEFPTSVLKSMNLSIPEVSVGEVTEQPSATVYLVIHTYDGD